MHSIRTRWRRRRLKLRCLHLRIVQYFSPMAAFQGTFKWTAHHNNCAWYLKRLRRCRLFGGWSFFRRCLMRWWKLHLHEWLLWSSRSKFINDGCCENFGLYFDNRGNCRRCSFSQKFGKSPWLTDRPQIWFYQYENKSKEIASSFSSTRFKFLFSCIA